MVHKIMGLDLSISATGLCVAVDEEILGTETIRTSPKDPFFARVAKIVSRIDHMEHTYKFTRDDLFVIEGPAYSFGGRVSRSVYDLGMLQGVVKWELSKIGMRVERVFPNTLKKFVTGKGNVKKNLMMMKAFKKWGVEFNNDNECDAFCLVKYAIEKIGDPNEQNNLCP